MSLEEFLALPEEKPALELEPDGTVTQKVSPKGKHSRAQVGLCKLFDAFAEPRRLALSFPELRTVFGGAAYVPDVAVYRWERIQWTADGTVPDDFTDPPDIAIEIVSPDQRVTPLVRKCAWYIEHGVPVVLLVDPLDESILLFRPNSLPRSLRDADKIEVPEVLPGFEASVDEVFAALKG